MNNIKLMYVYIRLHEKWNIGQSVYLCIYWSGPYNKVPNNKHVLFASKNKFNTYEKIKIFIIPAHDFWPAYRIINIWLDIVLLCV